MSIWHNIEIHISSVVMHDLNLDMHILLPLPYNMLWHKYNAHVVWIYFICFIYANFLFRQTFCFVNFGFDIWVF